MPYELTISEHNVLPHTDIEKDIQEKQNGLFTFTLRINNGQISDYNIMEYIDANKYISLKSITFEEHTISLNNIQRGQTDPLRDDNF